jgi:hypothetical protein
MIYIYNTYTDKYTDLYRQAWENLEEYMGEVVEDTTVYKIMFFVSLDDIFTQAKKRTAFRGRFAKDAKGNSLLEQFAITDDEQSLLEDLLKSGAEEVHKTISAWMQNDNESFQYNVTFGAKAPMGTITSDGGTTIIDSTAPFTGNLAGYKLVILDGTLENEERDIVSNTTDTLTIDRAFTGSVLGASYGVYNPEEKFITYALEMDLRWDFPMISAAETAIKEALTAFEMKEWYLANRYMEDFAIEEAKYLKELSKAKSALIQGKTSWSRPTDQFMTY